MSASAHEPGRLGPGAALALVAGSMLGIGIFIAPPVVAEHLDGPGAFLLMWVVGGMSAVFGALSVAELGGMLPRAGGDYPYLRRAYGPGFAFAAGWLQLLAIFPGSLATMAVGTATFQFEVVLGSVFDFPTRIGLPMDPAMFWAFAIVIVLTAINHFGVVMSGRFQVALTGLPVVVLLIAGVAVFATGGQEGGAWISDFGDQGIPDAAGLALAYLPVYFAYSGWNAAIFVGAEIRDPGRNVPRALVGGTLLVIMLYLVLCFGFLAVFPMEDLARAGEVGTAAAHEMFGAVGKFAVTVLIFVAMLGSINGTVLTGSRIAYAMAQHGHCMPQAGRLSRRFATPAVALWLQAGWSLVLISSQSFEQLMNYASSAMLITGTLTVLAVIVLRVRMPDHPRPYRTWGYPITPLLYAASSLVVLVILARDLDPSVFLGAGWFVLALGFHRLVLHGKASERDDPDDGAPPPSGPSDLAKS